MTIVYDHDRSEVAWVGEGREQPHWIASLPNQDPRRGKLTECVTMARRRDTSSLARKHTRELRPPRSIAQCSLTGSFALRLERVNPSGR
jgi:hypothetical protein